MSISYERKKTLINFCTDYSLEFKDLAVLDVALTHSSYIREQQLGLNDCYERLEFLGDAVLKLLISDFLYKNYPDYQEGILTKLRGTIVSDKTLAKFAHKISLEDIIKLGQNEKKSGGLSKGSILACAFEALLGAIYSEDSLYGFENAKNFVLSNFKDEILGYDKVIQCINPKATLQEYTQEKSKELPEYVTVNEFGEDHNKTFEVGVYYQGELLATACGKSKKDAQQECAKKALVELGIYGKDNFCEDYE